MGIPLATTQFAAYNGFAFPNNCKTTRIDITPERSQDGRSTIWNRWRFTIEFEIATSIGTTDAVVQGAIAALSHPGGVFTYRGRGLGNPDINTGDVGRDLKFGPFPSGISAKPIGTGNAVKITWNVEFVIPDCPGVSNPFGLLEFSVRAAHTVDDAGYVVRRVSGYLVIPNNRIAPGASQVLLSPDDYRDQVLTPLPFGFQRKGMTFDPSPDMTRLDFSWTDEELPVPLPPGIVEATFSDEVSSGSAGLMKWSGTLNASYRMVKGYNWLAAADAFFTMSAAILGDRQDRLQVRKQQGGNVNVKPDLPVGQGRMENVGSMSGPIPTGFRMTNPNRYGKPAAQFSLSYTFTCPLSQLIAATGMYLPFEHSYTVWVGTMADGPLNAYGGARIRWTTNDDPGISSVCYAPGELRGGGPWEPPTIPVPGEVSGGAPTIPAEQQTDPYISQLVRGTFAQPVAENSWLDYDNSIFLEADSGVLHVKKLPTAKPQQENGVFGTNGAVPPGGNAFGLVDFRQFIPPQFLGGGGRLVNETIDRGIMRRTNESCVVYLTGKAYRIGFPISPPRLVDINGIPCVPQCRPDRGEGFGQGVMSNAVQTVHYAYWRLRYVLTSVPPGPLPVPPNPFDKP